MSYILDALKKADSERQLGTVPNIHAQPLTHNALDDEHSAWKNPLLWVFLTVLVLMFGTFLLFHHWQNTPPAATISPSKNAFAPPSIPAVPSNSVASNDAAVLPTPPALPIAAIENSAPVEPLPSEPVKLKSSQKLQPQANKENRSSPASAAKSSSKKSALKQVAEPADEKIEMTLRDLPQTIQNEIPTLTVGGYIYSDNRAESQLLINKSLLHEGDQVAPGLILEKMMQHSAILNYKGYRYRISY